MAGLARRPLLLALALLGALPALYMALVWTQIVPETLVRFGQPWAALVVLAASAFVAMRLSAHTARHGRLRTWLSDGLVAVATLASGLAATEPELGRPLDRLTVVIVLDRSRSIDLVPNAEARVTRELAAAETGMRNDDLVAVVAFAADAATEQPPRKKSDPPAPQRAQLGRDGTDIGIGLRRALAELPADSAARVVLVSDGVATRGDALAAAAAAVASDIPVDVLALEQRLLPDIRVASLRMPPRANEGETIEMRLVVASPEPTEIEVRVERDGQPLQRMRAKVEAGEDVLRLIDRAPGPGLHRYDVAVSALDPRLDHSADDNLGSAFVRVRGAARALVLDGQPGRTAFVAAALRSAAFLVDEGGPGSMPPDIAGMAGYDLIVFGDVEARELSFEQLDALGSYVRDLGGGLWLLGGDRSMGPGGFGGTAVEEIAPVSFDLKQEKRRASLAEIISIDISGSMTATAGRHTKLELANEGAARSAELLGPGDQLGVVHVDTDPHWTVPLAPIGSDGEAVAQAIRKGEPGGGGIFVDVALAESYKALLPAAANLKHALLFADGADAENITPRVQAMVDDAARKGITTSVVSLGRGPDVPALEDLSRRGQGRFYLVEDAGRLPAIFAQETVLASRSALHEDPFRVALGSSSSVSAGIDFAAAPQLYGYVVTIAKARASTLLVGPENDPILAVWSAGIGRAAAFTSDLKDRWGRDWTGWPDAARLVVQAGRYLSRAEDDARVRLEADAGGGQLHLRATVVDDDGRSQSFRRLRATVSGPDGFRQDVALEPSGAGVYTTAVPLSRPGPYVAVVRDEVGGEPLATAGAALSHGEEMRPTGSDLGLLARIAELNGGRRRDTLAEVFLDRGKPRFSYQDVTVRLLVCAAFALLLAVAARRLSLPDAAWLARLAGKLRTAPQPTATVESAEATLGALLESRARRAPTEEPPRSKALFEREPPVAPRPRPTTRPPPQPSAVSLGGGPRRPSATRGEGGEAAPPATASPNEASPASRPKSATELLLERRRGRKR